MGGLIGIIKAARRRPSGRRSGDPPPEGTGPIGDSGTRSGGKGQNERGRTTFTGTHTNPPDQGQEDTQETQHELEGLEQPDLGVDPNEHLDIAGREMHGGEEGLDSNQQVGPLAQGMYEQFFEQEHPVGQHPGLPESANRRILEDPHSNVSPPTNRPETAGVHRNPQGDLPSSHHLQRPPRARRKIGVRSLAG